MSRYKARASGYAHPYNDNSSARGMQKNVRELWTALYRKGGVNALGLQSLERRVCHGRDTRAGARTQDERRVPQPPPQRQ